MGKTKSLLAAVAGEVTGSGKKADQNQGKSWCSFSGLNDDPTAPLDGSGPNGPGGRRSRLDRSTSWVCRIRMCRIRAPSATRTRHRFLRSRIGRK